MELASLLYYFPMSFMTGTDTFDNVLLSHPIYMIFYPVDFPT